MIRFEYDNIETDRLILEFKCKECLSSTKTDLLKVPDLDLDTLKDTSYSYKHICQYGACYTIDIINSIYDSYGVFAIWKTEKMRKDYAFQCKTVYVDQANKILHLYDFCESIDWNHVEKVKVHTINHNNYSRCEECIEWTYEMHDAARDLYLRHE